MSHHTVDRRQFLAGIAGATSLGIAGCMNDSGSMNDGADAGMDGSMPEPMDPSDAERVTIDRFSEEAGTLMVRGADNSLPGPGEPIDFDQGPFITSGLDPDGAPVQYYNFDVMPASPAPIYALFREGESMPVDDQLNIVGTVPGDDGYNDFWHVHKVTVPTDYVANTATSVADLQEAGYSITPTNMVKNCPIVPDGSTAMKRHGDTQTGLVTGWYDGKLVSYFLFEEAPITVTDGSVPLSPIYVAFNTNPNEDGGGPASGFMTESDSTQTHNVVATVPGDEGYSPLWRVNVYNNSDFGSVMDLESAQDADILAMGAAMVNCPIVSVM
ncbi:MAG: hypothetical protein U5K37_11960 [Natrialbaceae archaeon]|nr:hypothetical protein [Natrialbaceae archaeon]